MSVMSQKETWFRSVARSRALRYLPVTAFVLDLFVVSLSTLLAGLIRERWDELFGTRAEVLNAVTVAGPAIILVWVACLFFSGGYRSSQFEVGTDEFRRVAVASLSAAGLVGVGCYLLNYPLSRGFFFVTFAVGLAGLMLQRLALRQVIHAARSLGGLQHHVIIVGSRFGVDEVANVITREKRLGFQVIGCLTPTNDPAPETDGGIPVLGNCDSVTETVAASGADVVFFASGGLTSAGQMRRIAWELEHHDVQVVVAPSISEVSGDRVSIRPVGGLPLIHLEPPRATDAARWGKRSLDIVGSLGLLLLASPVLAFAAARIKLHDGGPVLFRQMRTGRDGEEFSLLKFRTMVTDAEKKLAELHAKEGYDGGLFKMERDPRITKPGQWLRRFSIDELPQLVNVLRGEMSLVGPRPPLPLEVAQYHGDMSRRLHVRPGLTGLWQVSGRSNLSFEEAIRLDLYYVDNWSMFQDISILYKTMGAVVRSHGAY
ncbi:sugar transferase [Nocardioides sp.]|uniref:sugar transferase n=1 Tax=Nocardioides sp. TaxID=35761 RepID=UPI002B26A572|nr:sugar transferase [Nocardioides sp.]